jgi:hypothetical protein
MECGAPYLEAQALTALADAIAHQGDQPGAALTRHRAEEIYRTVGLSGENHFVHRPDF